MTGLLLVACGNSGSNSSAINDAPTDSGFAEDGELALEAGTYDAAVPTGDSTTAPVMDTGLVDAQLVETNCDLDGSGCLPGGASVYQVAIDPTNILGTGYGRIEVAIVTSVSTPPQTLVLGLTRPEVGVLSGTAVTQGVPVYFTPCNVTLTPTCVGEFQITVAFAADPSHLIAASVPLAIVTPAPVGDVSACSGPGDVLHVEGDPGEMLYSGVTTITGGVWAAYESPANNVHMTVTPDPAQPSLGWTLHFSTDRIPTPFVPSTYEGAYGASGNAGNPGLDITVDGLGCPSTGSFQVQDATFSGTAVKSLVVSFEQQCDGETAALRGCVRIAN
ncbi:MAG: hypothetical protein ACHREM_17900 [Polyangiales bacterium]